MIALDVRVPSPLPWRARFVLVRLAFRVGVPNPLHVLRVLIFGRTGLP